jgi:hypothetical protein
MRNGTINVHSRQAAVEPCDRFAIGRSALLAYHIQSTMRNPAPALYLLFLSLTLHAAETPNTNSFLVPAKFHRGRVFLTGAINKSKPLSLLLDTGCSIPTLHPDLADELKLQQWGHVRINGIAGEERAPTYKGAVFDFGGASYAPFRVAAVPSERKESRRRDGVVGSGLFNRFVVEIDPQAKTVRLYSPTNFTYSGKGDVLSFRLREEIPVLKASIILSDKAPVEGEYEIDTGCDSGLCLGESFIQCNKLLDSVKARSSEKFGLGGSISTKSGAVPVFRLGKTEVREPDTDFFVGGSPVDEPLAGHIGMGILRQFKVIIDYSHRQIILESPAQQSP